MVLLSIGTRNQELGLVAGGFAATKNGREKKKPLSLKIIIMLYDKNCSFSRKKTARIAADKVLPRSQTLIR